jgi:hypothetical protein
MMRGKIRETVMSQVEDIQASAQEIADGLKKIGPNRVVALSVHVTKDLIAELEAKANKLVADLDSLKS